MNIEEGRILALNGAMLADGSFEFEGEEAAMLLTPPNAMVMVRPFEGIGSSEIALVGNARRDSDGFWSSDWPAHSLRFERNLAPLGRLFDYPSFPTGAHQTKLHFRAEQGGLAWLALGMTRPVNTQAPSLLGHANDVAIEMERFPDSATFIINASANAMKRGEEPAPPIRVRARFTMTLSTNTLGAGIPGVRHGQISNLRGDGAEPGPIGQILKISDGGMPFFDGHFELGPGLPDYCRGDVVSAGFFGRQAFLRPERSPTRLDSGFYRGNSLGPQLVLNHFGPERWKEMLRDADEAELIQSGSGIGFSQLVTGPSTQDEGPHIQQITMARTRLRRSQEGLAVSVLGELGPYDQKPTYEPLGPDFAVEFFVPTAFFFARGLTFGKMWQERKQRLENLEGPSSRG